MGRWALGRPLFAQSSRQRRSQVCRSGLGGTLWIIQHGSLVAGFMTGRFDVVSVSAAASTGIMDLRSAQWQPAMLDALESAEYRQFAAGSCRESWP